MADTPRLDAIKGRWKYFLEDTWHHADQRERVTGAGAVAFAPSMKRILLIVKHEAAGPNTPSIIVAAVADTAPLVQDVIAHAPEDIAYLLHLLESPSGRSPMT